MAPWARGADLEILARELLGGNGILLDDHVGRFVADSKAIYSYEGTREMNILIVGTVITGLSSFVLERRFGFARGEETMKSILKTAVALTCGLLVGGGAVQILHAQSKPPAFVVAEIDVKDLEGYEMNFLKPAQKTIADHGGKYLAGGFNKTLSLAGTEPPNRVVLLQFASMDAVEDWRKEGEADLENDVGEKYAKFRVYAVEGLSP